MKLFNRNAALFLAEKTKSIHAEAMRWRCIHIDFSTSRNQCSEGLRNYAATTITQALKEEDGFIYLCKDGNIFILFSGKVGDIVEKLGQHFKDLGQPYRDTHPHDTLYTVYDFSLDSHWQQFYTQCQERAALLVKQNEEPSSAAPAHLPLRDLNNAAFQLALASRRDHKRLQVLVVEDDPFTRRLVTGTLKSDYDVVEASDGASALKAYETYAPDAVFLDIELPDTNGHIVLNKLLSFDASAFVVMLSANSVKENILAALEKGAQGFATKPFAREKLIHYLRLCESMRRCVSHAGAVHD